MTLSDTEQKRTQALEALIVAEIQQAGGSIPFSTYMHHALYAPQLGYYMAKANIFGATETQGDFTTAPEISGLFGETLAQVCHQILKKIPDAVILELGAGSGQLAVDLIKALIALGTPPKAYWILDPSLMLRKQQRLLLEQHFALSSISFEWLDVLPDPSNAFSGIVIANEVLDAMPAQRFMITPDACFETHVTHDNGHFKDIYKPTHDPDIQAIAKIIEIDTAYHSERLPALPAFFDKLSGAMQQGVILLMDYGFPQHEFYHPDRWMGTLMCHYQQRAHTDPYQWIGLQDITTHVDFTHVAEQATRAGLTVAGYTQQAAFLMNAGLLQQMNPTQTAAIHLLTSPSEMGEIFKVMALTKNLDIEPFPGFEHFDKRHTL